MNKVLFVLIILVIFTMVMPLSADTKAKAAKKCAVCGSEIAADAPVVKSEYKGVTYYFAIEKCKEKFAKNPDKYAQETETYYACSNCKLKSLKPRKCPKCGKQMAEHVSKVHYVCPMKQCNVKSNKPGKCPKCSMALKKVSVHDHTHTGKHNHKH